MASAEQDGRERGGCDIGCGSTATSSALCRHIDTQTHTDESTERDASKTDSVSFCWCVRTIAEAPCHARTCSTMVASDVNDSTSLHTSLRVEGKSSGDDCARSRMRCHACKRRYPQLQSSGCCRGPHRCRCASTSLCRRTGHAVPHSELSSVQTRRSSVYLSAVK